MSRLKVKTVVFVSNYFNHHQRPLADAFYEIYKDGYRFIETEPMEEERRNMGWGEANYPEYVVSSDEFLKNRHDYVKIINNADVVIVGSAPNWLIEGRIKNKKIIFRYSERPLKINTQKWKYPIRLITWRKYNPAKKFMNVLCASAYTSADYAKFGLYINRAYKWGYFPKVKEYADIDGLISGKKKNSILWCARFIELKHPEKAVEVAKRLKCEGYDFNLYIIGTGVMEEGIKKQIAVSGLSDCVHMLGSMSPEQVREKMEESEIFLFTSDRNEGWGAVLNESMNSGCAVVASHAIGSVPFLVRDKENGMIYKDSDIDDLYNKVKYLLDNPEERKRISQNAYKTMVNEWNAENAAKKFSVLSECLLNGEKCKGLFESGVCSKSQILKDNWYK